MTLNVIVENMVAVDSEVSFHNQRTSDDYEKSEVFDRENYKLVIIGNGSGLTLLDAVSFIQKDTSEGADSLIIGLEKYMKQKEDKRYKDYLEQEEERIKAKYSTISDPKVQEAHITQEFGEKVVDKLYESGNRPNGCLYLVVYDEKQKSLRKFALPSRKGSTFGELYSTHVLVDGSGGDLAGAYLSTQTSGMGWNKIKPAYTFYLIALACAAATANTGVGGFMQVISVDEQGAKYIPEDRVNSAVRVLAKQIAGDLSKKQALKMIELIYNGIADYQEIAKRLDLTLNDLLYSPARLHQDVSKFNRLLQQK